MSLLGTRGRHRQEAYERVRDSGCHTRIEELQVTQDRRPWDASGPLSAMSGVGTLPASSRVITNGASHSSYELVLCLILLLPLSDEASEVLCGYRLVLLLFLKAFRSDYQSLLVYCLLDLNV